MKRIGQRIAKYRKFKGLSLRQLSSLTNVSYGYLSKIENATKIPTIETLYTIAEGLGIPVKWLVSEEEDYYQDMEWYYKLPPEIQRFLVLEEAKEFINVAYFIYNNKFPLTAIKLLIMSAWLFNQEHIANNEDLMVRKPNKQLLELMAAVSKGYFDRGVAEGLYVNK